MPDRHSGRPSIVVSLRAQEAYLYRGRNRAASSRISSGREGYRTPIGHFRVIRKDNDHRSSLYGDYVDASGKIVKANVDSRRDRKPPHSHFVGAPMPYFLEFSPGYGLHRVTCRRARLTRLHQVALLESAAVLRRCPYRDTSHHSALGELVTTIVASPRAHAASAKLQVWVTHP